MGNYINEALLGTNPHKARQEEMKAYVAKWERTGLLDGLEKGHQKNNMAQLLENQAKELLSENSRTSPSGGSDEEWSGVALPLVRRIFGEVAAQEFVSVQPMNLPSGLVFYLDFKYGTNTSAHGGAQAPDSEGADVTSIHGKTGPNNPEGATSPFGEGGLYGAGRYGYSINESASAAAGLGSTLAATTFTTGSLSLADDLFHDTEFSASHAGTFGTGGSTFKLSISSASFDGNFDPLAVRSFQLSGSNTGGTNITVVYPQFTKLTSNNSAVEFVCSGSGLVTTTSASMIYSVQPTDTTRGDFEDTVGNATADTLAIPEVDLQLNSTSIVAKTRKLKAVWTPELSQDLNAYHSVDAEAELTGMLSEYVSMEIDLEILDMLISDATTTDFWSAKVGKVYDGSAKAFVNGSQQAGDFAYTRSEWYQTLVEKVQKVSNEIHRLTLRGGANFVVCGPKVSTILESIPGFGTSGGDATSKSYAMGVQSIGALGNRWTVYKNPYMNENTILVGFRGGNFLETGAVYAPYVPLIMTPLVYDPSDFTPRKGVMTRYAKKMIRPEFYAKIYVSDLNLI